MYPFLGNSLVIKMNLAMVFDYSKKNFYSLTSLIATLDLDKDLQEIDVILEEKLDASILKSLLNKYDHLVVGFSFRTAKLPEIYERLKNIYKSLHPSELRRITFIAGGSHASGSPLTTLKTGFDFAFIGEAEYSLPFFLKQMILNEEIFRTPGIAYLENADSYKLTEKPAPIVLDDYPFMSQTRKLYPPLELSRGCAFGCTFCQVPTLFEHRTRHRSVEVIVDTVKWMSEKKLNDIRFITPNSLGYMSSKPRVVNQEAIVELLSSIRKVDGIRDLYFGTFPGEVRPETVSKELMKDIKPYISNSRISIGLQSGSNDVLREIHRGHTVEEGIDAINILLDIGFTPVVDIIIGLPSASEEDELETIHVIEELTKRQTLIRAHVFMPLPGTKLEDTPFKPVYPKIRKMLGKLSSKGKIEGNWTNQEKYAQTAWETSQKLLHLPSIMRPDNGL